MSDHKLTHIDEHGNAVMVDVSGKAPTVRTAIACGSITMNQEAFTALTEGTAKKGDVIGVARVAGIMAVKKTSELIPLCHPLPVRKVSLDFTPCPESLSVRAECLVKTEEKTGVEMEALTGVSVALLTVYDMLKAVDKGMEINGIHLVEKHGGKSGDYYRDAAGKHA